MWSLVILLYHHYSRLISSHHITNHLVVNLVLYLYFYDLYARTSSASYAIFAIGLYTHSLCKKHLCCVKDLMELFVRGYKFLERLYEIKLETSNAFIHYCANGIDE